jgi:hypothetical protein
VGKALFGGGGSGPVGGGALAGRPALWIGSLAFMLEALLCSIDELEVRGGNSGLPLDSIALAGSGMLSLLLKPRRFVRGYCPFAGISSVSSERCCRDRGGGGDLWAMPVGVADCDDGAVKICPKRCGDWMAIIGISPVVGLAIFAEPVVDAEGVLLLLLVPAVAE